MYTLKIGGSIVALCMVAGCSGIQYEMPEIQKADEHAALADIETFSLPSSTNVMSEGAAERQLFDVYAKIKPSAIDVCRYAGENNACAWVISYNNSREINAGALGGNTVVVFHGIISVTDNDDELAFVLSHELGHHIADHISESRKHVNTGILIAGLAMAAASHGSTGCTTYSCLNNLQNAAQASMQLGGNISRLVFSVEQEKEADYLAAHILNLAGYDLAKSRTMLVKLGAMSDEKETTFLSSHPAGPERLASYDISIEVIQNDTDGLPGKEQFEEDNAPITSSSSADGSDTGNKDLKVNEFDPTKCRIYLPDEDICIY